jgi:putative tricarboxylic transport membrane protein
LEAILIGGLTIQGLQPGPLLFENSPEIPYSIFAALLVSVPIMVIFGLMGLRLWVRVTAIPKGIVAVVVAAICILGSYASTNSVFTIGITVVFGIIGYIFRKAKINPAPIVLALVLGVMMETNFRRAMTMSGNDWGFFFTKPISAILLGAALLVLLGPIFRNLWGKFKKGHNGYDSPTNRESADNTPA